MYTTWDEGRTFLVEKLARNIEVSESRFPAAALSMRRVIRVSDIKPA